MPWQAAVIAVSNLLPAHPPSALSAKSFPHQEQFVLPGEKADLDQVHSNTALMDIHR